MDPLLKVLVVAVVACILGIVIGWRIGMRRYYRFLIDVEHETGARSLELLETRQHLRKISAHLKINLKKDKTIRQLKSKQKSILRKFNQQTDHTRRQEKAHFIQTAKIKLELIEARLQNGQPANLDTNGVQHNGYADTSSKEYANGNSDDNYLTAEHPDSTSTSPATLSSATISSANKDFGQQDFGQLNNELQLLLKKAGINRVRQLANLSKQDIDQLTKQTNRHAAE